MQFDSIGDKMFRVNEKGRPKPSFLSYLPVRGLRPPIYRE
ncbi:hypothetical protein QFZ42_003285 [Variovorax paradoxus]|jgi:hypothetical protein|nr:hypothetical protein [Variovorax paradoxus]